MERKEGLQPERRVIKLGQKFRPFDPAENILQRGRYHPDSKASRIVLSFNMGENLAFDIELLPSIAMKGLSITPFNPEIGYQIDSEDLEQESRRKKTIRLLEELEKRIDYDEPFILDINCPSFMQHKALYEELRVLVRFPLGSYEAKSRTFYDESTGKPTAVTFGEFYPQDAGPLPGVSLVSNRVLLGRTWFNFWIYLPNEPEKLKQVEMQFALVPEESQDAEINSA